MNKIVIAPDSFKGTLSARTVCAVMEEAVRRHFPEAEVICVPAADGGEGTVDCMLAAAGGEKRYVRVSGPFGDEMEAFYGILPGGAAVIEMAACAGLPLAQGRLDPLRATTYGVGQLMAAAVDAGCREIILGLGGSATNDCGCGAVAAAGAVFRDGDGRQFVPTGGTLHNIECIDLSALEKRFSGVKITAMCDIDNPAYGPRGAAHIFGPQKGADAQTVELLDAGVSHLCALLRDKYGKDLADVPGAGAAGAMGLGMMAFFGAQLRPGIEAVLDAALFDERAAGADLILTGEGRFDVQSLGGKAVIGVARRAKKLGIPVVAVAGGAHDVPEAYAEGVTAVFSINRLPEDFEVARHKSEANLAAEVDNIMRLVKAIDNS